MNLCVLLLLGLLGTVVSKLTNSTLEETLSDDEEFELFQGILLELEQDQEDGDNIMTTTESGPEEEEQENHVAALQDTNIVDDIIDELGEDLVEIIQKDGDGASNVYLVIGISVSALLLCTLLIVLLWIRFRRKLNLKSFPPVGETRAEDIKLPEENV